MGKTAGQRVSQVHTRALMRAVVEDSFDGIIITDESGHVELANRAAGQILARPTSDLVGRPIDEGLRGARALPVPRKLSAEAETPKHDIELRRDDGTVVSLEVVVSVSDSRISQRFYERRQRARTLFIYTFRDVSDRQRAAAAQLRALQAATAANRAKSEFLANMSHELRTPLNAIIGFSEVILAKTFGAVGHDRYVDYIHDINTSGRHLLSIIEQVLDLSQVETGVSKIDEGVMSLAEAVADSEKIIRGWLMKMPRRMVVEVPPELPSIRADRRLIRQILLNLIGNAIKFTSAEGVIRVRVYLDAERRPAIEVEDNGIGIPADKLEAVTQAFYQVNPQVEIGKAHA